MADVGRHGAEAVGGDVDDGEQPIRQVHNVHTQCRLAAAAYGVVDVFLTILLENGFPFGKAEVARLCASEEIAMRAAQVAL